MLARRDRTRKNVGNIMDNDLQTVTLMGAGEPTPGAQSVGAEQATIGGDKSATPGSVVETQANQLSQTEPTQPTQPEQEQRIPYTRFQEKVQEVNALREQLQTMQQMAQAIQGQVPQQQVDPQIAQAKEALASLGVVTEDKMVSTLEQFFAYKEAQSKFIDNMKTLEGKYTGQDGMPKFVPQEIAEYMDMTGISDPEKAYREKYLDQIADAMTKQNRSTPFTEKPGQPMQTAGDDEKAMMDQARRTGDYTSVILNRMGNNTPWSKYK